MFYSIFAAVSVVIVLALLLLVLFEPPLRYAVTPPDLALDSEKFVQLLGALSDARVHKACRIETFLGGEAFYAAEIAAVRAAQRSIHWEAFLFTPAPITAVILEALTERARAGVQVKLVLDAIGCFHTPDKYFKELRAAGGRVEWYQPIRWYTLKRVNNRTHRELIVIDGEIGFIGGAGVAAHWSDGDGDGRPPWRDMMCRIEGKLVAGLQSTFAENWLESSGEILAGGEFYPALEEADHPESSDESRGMVVMSTPSAARSTRARVLFQTLLASARKTIEINSPYFVPDRSARAEIVRAARDRGVRVRVVTPGEANNHPMTRRASRRIYGQLLEAGVEIYEYQPGMIHKKAMTIDGIWAVIGSTNFDTRSFGLNDEVNLAAVGGALSKRLEDDFADEVAHSRRITLEEWSRRPMLERFLALPGRLLERQE